MAPTTRHHTRRGTGWLATDSQSINFQQVLSPSQPRIVAVHVRRPSVVNSAPDTTNPSITFGWGIDERGYLREHDPIPQLPRGSPPVLTEPVIPASGRQAAGGTGDLALRRSTSTGGERSSGSATG